jgi:hypothetical protein
MDLRVAPCSTHAASSSAHHSASLGARCRRTTARSGPCGPGWHVAVGMARQGYDLQLTRYDKRGWRAMFYTTGMEHSPTSATGTAWERTPRHATQRAACGGL